jgi:hypothetical protein
VVRAASFLTLTIRVSLTTHLDRSASSHPDPPALGSCEPSIRIQIDEREGNVGEVF